MRATLSAGIPAVTTSAPGPSRPWLNDQARATGADPLRFLLDLVAEFGDVVRYPTLYGPVYFFNHPDGVRQVLHSTHIVRTSLVSLALGQGLLSSDGDYWRGQRRVAQPSFHESCLRGFAPLIVAATRRRMANWKVPVGGSIELDIAHEMKLLTLDIVTRAMFSADLSAHAEPLCAAIGTMVEDLGGILGTLLNAPGAISPARNARFAAARAVVDEVVYALIEARRAEPNPPRDLLSSFLAARDAQTGASLTNEQLRDEVVTILIAGHETTAISLAWAFHLLGQNPDCARQLHDECARISGEPTMENLPKLGFAEQVFQEAMRLYPPVWVMIRRAVEACEIAGHPVPAGAYVAVSAYSTQRHPQFWPDAERFDPRRFAPDAAKSRPLYAHFPFAGGRHLCLGARFAIIEAQLILAMLARDYAFEALPAPPVVPLPVLTLRQQFGVPMKVTRR